METRATIAGRLEDGASRILQALTDEGGAPTGAAIDQALGIAQVQATLALGQRVADLTDRLGDYLGDDSHVDGIKQAVCGVDDRLSDIRQGMPG